MLQLDRDRVKRIETALLNALPCRTPGDQAHIDLAVLVLQNHSRAMSHRSVLIFICFAIAIEGLVRLLGLVW